MSYIQDVAPGCLTGRRMLVSSGGRQAPFVAEGFLSSSFPWQKVKPRRQPGLLSTSALLPSHEPGREVVNARGFGHVQSVCKSFGAPVCERQRRPSPSDPAVARRAGGWRLPGRMRELSRRRTHWMRP